MLKAVVFDYGGVIETKEGNLFQEIVNFLQVDIKDWERVYFSLNHLHNVGKHNGDETVFLTAKEFSVSDEQISYIKNLIIKIRKTKKINYELLEFIKKLKSKNYKIGLLSNNSVDLNQRLMDKNLAGVFDVKVVSSETGYQKPQPEIFKILADKLNVKLDELLFVDDTKKSLEGAEKIGYIPVLYTTNQKLTEELERLGI